MPRSLSALGMKEVPTLDEGSASLLWLEAKGELFVTRALHPLGTGVDGNTEMDGRGELLPTDAVAGLQYPLGTPVHSPLEIILFPNPGLLPPPRLPDIPRIQQKLPFPASCCPLSALCCLPQFLYSKGRSPVRLLLFPCPRLRISAHPAVPPQAFPLPSSD